MLALIDLTFTANLVLIVIFSGYENFVSKFEAGDHDRPDWMTKVDFGGLKQKLMTSIVAISAIQVLKAFMNIDQSAGAPDSAKLAWLVGIHVLFLGSLLAVVIADRLSDPGKPAAEKPHRHAEVRRQGVSRGMPALSAAIGRDRRRCEAFLTISGVNPLTVSVGFGFVACGQAASSRF